MGGEGGRQRAGTAVPGPRGKGVAVARAGGRRVAVKTASAVERQKEKKRREKQEKEERRKKEKAKERRKYTKLDFSGSKASLVYAISAIVVFFGAITAYVAYRGVDLPDPIEVANAVGDRILVLLTARNLALVAVSLCVAVGAAFLVRKHKELQEKNAREAELAAVERKRKALSEKRQMFKDELQRKKIEIEQTSYARKADQVKAIQELEKLRKQEREESERMLEELQREEAAIAMEIKRQTEQFQVQSAVRESQLKQEELEQKARKKGKLIPFGDEARVADWEQYRGHTGDSSTDDGSDDGSADDDGDGEEEEVELELNPQPQNFQIEMETLDWIGIGTLRPESLSFQLACNRCSALHSTTLSGRFAAHTSLSRRCTLCKAVIRCAFRPQLLHENSRIVGYVDTENAQPTDIAQCLFSGSCLNCAAENTFPKPALRARPLMMNCHQCHHKLSSQVTAFSVAYFSATGEEQEYPKPGTLEKGKKANKSNSRGATSARPYHGGHVIKRGSPLPDEGTCKHFGRSYRWLRFPCCSFAFPCPICHEESGCEGAVDNVIATRAICGRCSAEQNVGGQKCNACKANFTSKRGGAGHWNSGKGLRDTSSLSSKERKKNQGVSRTGVAKTQSKKSQRVGKAGKAATQKASSKQKT